MNKRPKPLVVVFVLVLALSGVAILRKALEPKEIVPWRRDFAAAKAEAAATNRPMLVYFMAKWCPGCQQLAASTWADAQVEAALRQWVAVQVDVDQQPGLAVQFGINPLPAMVLLSPSGQPLRYRVGYQDAEEFLSWLGGATAQRPTTAAVP